MNTLPNELIDIILKQLYYKGCMYLTCSNLFNFCTDFTTFNKNKILANINVKVKSKKDITNRVLINEVYISGNFKVFKQLFKYYYIDDNSINYELIIKYNHIKIIKWLLKNKYVINYLYHRAARYGHFKILKLARKYHYPWDKEVCNIAAYNGHLEILKWVCLISLRKSIYIDNGERKKDLSWSYAIVLSAAKKGHLEILKWAYSISTFKINIAGLEKGDYFCFWSNAACCEAAYGGHFEILKWMFSVSAELGFKDEKGFKFWNKAICSNAASRGHFEILKWARENGCPWNERVCSNAVHYGHFDMLKWARENGCPWNKEECMYFAEFHSCSKIIEWIKTQ